MAVVTTIILASLLILTELAYSMDCPNKHKKGNGPPADCPVPVDPNNKPKSRIERWFTKEIFTDLFPRANIGHGPSPCWPYSYEAFVIAARYFPRFGTESPLRNGYTARENHRRDLIAFFAHAIQETGENDGSLYETMDKDEAHDCFYRGGFYNWFEGGPSSNYLSKHDFKPSDGDACTQSNLYCSGNTQNKYFWNCTDAHKGSGSVGCYIGRGAIQISWNYNYGRFQKWLQENGIEVNLLENPNLIMTKMDPPISIMASLWFYMTPQPPKPAMHDIIMGNWHAGPDNELAGYKGPIFGPTSLVINNECGGEDKADPGGPGESRRIKAFKWFAKYFGVPVEDDQLLTCKGMPQRLDEIRHDLSYGPDWTSTWKDEPCRCAPAGYGGIIFYHQPGFYPKSFIRQNRKNKAWCERILNEHPTILGLSGDARCLQYDSNSVTELPEQQQSTTETEPEVLVTIVEREESTTTLKELTTTAAPKKSPTKSRGKLTCQWDNQKLGKDCQTHYLKCQIMQWYPVMKYKVRKASCARGTIFYGGDCYGNWALEACGI